MAAISSSNNTADVVSQVYHSNDVKATVPPPLASLVGGPLQRSDSDESADKMARLGARVSQGESNGGAVVRTDESMLNGFQFQRSHGWLYLPG